MRSALLTAAVTCLLLAGCTAAPAPAPAPSEPVAPTPVGTEGVYDLDFGQFTGIYVIVDGEFWGLHFLGDTLAGHPHAVVTDDNSSHNQEPIGWANFVDDGRRVGTMEPSGTFGRTFTESDVTVAITGSMGSFSAKSTQQKVYADGSPIFGTAREVTGEYIGLVRTVGIEHKQEDVVSFSIASDGTLDAVAVGCNFVGTLTARGSSGLFDAVVDASGDDCLLQPELTGIVVHLDDDTIAVELDADDATQSAVFIVQRA